VEDSPEAEEEEDGDEEDTKKGCIDLCFLFSRFSFSLELSHCACNISFTFQSRFYLRSEPHPNLGSSLRRDHSKGACIFCSNLLIIPSRFSPSATFSFLSSHSLALLHLSNSTSVTRFSARTQLSRMALKALISAALLLLHSFTAQAVSSSTTPSDSTGPAVKLEETYTLRVS
jgi:hypothetical protein